MDDIQLGVDEKGIYRAYEIRGEDVIINGRKGYKTNKYFWVFDKTDALLKDAEDFHKAKREEKSKAKESDVVATE